MSAGKPKNVVVLGSTGSVGTQALDVARHMPDRVRVIGLSAWSRWELLADQVEEFEPEVVALGDEGAERLGASLNGRPVSILQGPEALAELARWANADLVLSAVSGAAGLPAAVAALECGKVLAVANKEALVMAGPQLVALAAERGAAIIPVDSEHSALFQLLRALRPEEVERVMLTASGGPFYGMSRQELAGVRPEDALRHPTWRMGRKITVDSATLMNKALEVVEARWLFGLPPERISVVIHPQCVVHCMVEVTDGSVLTHMGVPDMRLPIQYALTYPDRLPRTVARLDLKHMGRLEFREPDFERFPALGLGYRVARTGGTSGAVLSGANEGAVTAFLDGQMGFADIARVVEMVLDRHRVEPDPTFDDIMRADRWAREEARRCWESL